MQLRLANEGQLAAHTPRPLAPADSRSQLANARDRPQQRPCWLAARRQTDESCRTFRLLQKHNLDGSKLKLLRNFPGEQSSNLPNETPLLLSCEDDRVELILNIREVAHGRDKIRNFPSSCILQASTRWHGCSPGARWQLCNSRVVDSRPAHAWFLHSVFGKLLEKGAEIDLLPEKVKSDPRLKGLMVTQLVIDNGWVGLALGGQPNPQRTGLRRFLGPHAETMMR